MSESTELVATEQPQQLITIEPKKYVELVFEPFAKQYADAIDAVREVAYDIKTTAGMSTAIKHRAVFRDIRVASEKARKLRKAPILEIGKLLDSRAGEIEATLLPLETLFDEEIKSEEGRKEAEKAAKLAAEQQRIADIRARIDVFRNAPATMVGKTSQEIGVLADHLSESVISLGTYAEFAGECQVERDHAVKKLREMQGAQQAHEAEQQRLADERAALAKERAEAAERDRLAALERQRVEDEQRIAKAKAEAAMLAERQAHQRKLDEQRREVEQQQAAQQAAADKMAAAMSEIQGIQHQVMIATLGRSGVRKGGTIECIRETLAETEAWEIDAERFGILAGSAANAKESAITEIRRLLADAERKEAEDAEARRQREEAEAAALREQTEAEQAAAEKAAREKAERDATEAEAARRVQVQFEQNGPEPTEIIAVLADHYNVSPTVVRHWLGLRFWAQEEKAA